MENLSFDAVKAFIKTLNRDQVHELQGLIAEASYSQKNLDQDTSSTNQQETQE